MRPGEARKVSMRPSCGHTRPPQGWTLIVFLQYKVHVPHRIRHEICTTLAPQRPTPRRGTTEGTRKTAHTVRIKFLKFLKTLRAVQTSFCKKSDVEFDCEKTIREACWKKKALPTQRSPTKPNSPRRGRTHRVANPARSKSPNGHLGRRSKALYLRVKVHLQCIALARHAFEVDFDMQKQWFS